MSLVFPSVLTVWTMGFGTAAADVTIESMAEDTANAVELADQSFVLAAGSLLFALGIGIVLAASVTYWYKCRQIRSRLE